MLGLLLRSPHRRATSSGSVSLNSPFDPSHAMQDELDESESSSSKNCQSWTWPPPTAPELPAPAVDPISEQVCCRRLNLSAKQKTKHACTSRENCELLRGQVVARCKRRAITLYSFYLPPSLIYWLTQKLLLFLFSSNINIFNLFVILLRSRDTRNKIP